jgi:hypothetical protein
MKKGKSCALKGYKNLKSTYGTVDSKNLKSIYINIQTWAQPKILSEDWAKQVSYLNKQIKNIVSEILDKFIYNQNFIVDLDLRSSGISHGKRSFLNLEITLFFKEIVDFKSIRVKASVKDIVNTINKEIFNTSKIFDFYLSKNDKIVKMDIV